MVNEQGFPTPEKQKTIYLKTIFYLFSSKQSISCHAQPLPCITFSRCVAKSKKLLIWHLGAGAELSWHTQDLIFTLCHLFVCSKKPSQCQCTLHTFRHKKNSIWQEWLAKSFTAAFQMFKLFMKKILSAQKKKKTKRQQGNYWN